jgi:hypothetical protein
MKAGLRRLHVANALEELFGLLRRHLRDDPRRLLRRSRRPAASDALHKIRDAAGIRGRKVDNILDDGTVIDGGDDYWQCER